MGCRTWLAGQNSNHRLETTVCEKLGPLQNRKNGPTSKIGQKYTKNTENPIFLVFVPYFWPILRVAVFSYPVEGQVFPKPPFTNHCLQTLEVLCQGTEKGVIAKGGFSLSQESAPFPENP